MPLPPHNIFADSEVEPLLRGKKIAAFWPPREKGRKSGPELYQEDIA